jgi:hypothetical protein
LRHPVLNGGSDKVGDSGHQLAALFELLLDRFKLAVVVGVDVCKASFFHGT